MMFQAHPDDLSDDDIDVMVKELRDNRQHFKAAKASKSKEARIPAGSLDEMLALIGLGKDEDKGGK